MSQENNMYEDFEVSTPFLEWVGKNKDTIFSYSVYRRMFTPKEEEEKYIDETVFETSNEAKIAEAIPLGEDEYLLGLRDMFYDYDTEEWTEAEYITYYYLSEIRLTVYKANQPSED